MIRAFAFSAAFPNLASDDHYTAKELRELVTYADRAVRIVPELDMPGHVTSWLVSHPEWGTQKTAASRRFGVHSMSQPWTRLSTRH